MSDDKILEVIHGYLRKVPTGTYIKSKRLAQVVNDTLQRPYPYTKLDIERLFEKGPFPNYPDLQVDSSYGVRINVHQDTVSRSNNDAASGTFSAERLLYGFKDLGAIRDSEFTLGRRESFSSNLPVPHPKVVQPVTQPVRRRADGGGFTLHLCKLNCMGGEKFLCDICLSVYKFAECVHHVPHRDPVSNRLQCQSCGLYLTRLGSITDEMIQLKF